VLQLGALSENIPRQILALRVPEIVRGWISSGSRYPTWRR